MESAWVSGAGLALRSSRENTTSALVEPGLCTHTVVYQYEGATPGPLPTEGRKTSVPENPA